MKNETASNVEVVRKRKMAIKIVEKREKLGNFDLSGCNKRRLFLYFAELNLKLNLHYNDFEENNHVD